MEISESLRSEQSVKKAVVRGGAWIYGRKVVTSLLHLGVMAILARQLGPAEFGLIALAQGLLNLLAILSSQGVNEYVIYDNEVGREERVEAAFWLDLSLSIASVILGLICLPLITKFYSEPGLDVVMVSLLLRYPIDALSRVPDALLKKRLEFRKLQTRDVVLDFLSSVGKIALALNGWGVWSLILPAFLISMVRAIVVFRMAKWKPRFVFHLNLWPVIFSYSGYVVGSTLTSYVINQGDTLLIGKLMGSQVLGIYSLAWSSAHLIIRNVNGVVNQIALPALSAASGDTAHLWFGLRRMMRLLSIITFPALIGLFVVADDFILAVYGPQWRDAILPLRILLIYALRYAVGSPIGPVFKARGRTDIPFKLGLAIVPFYLIGIWIGSRYGLVGVAMGVTLTRTAFGVVGFELVSRMLDVNFRKVVAPMVPSFLASCLMGCVVLSVKALLDVSAIEDNHLLTLGILMTLGGLTFLALLRTYFRDLARDLAGISRPILGSGVLQSAVNRMLAVQPVVGGS